MLNDAILMAAGELAHQPRENRKIIFVISNGYEYGSRASYAQVLKVLLTNGIAIYAVGVEAAATPGLSKLDKLHIPAQGYTNILPKYANATGGDVIDSYSRGRSRPPTRRSPRRPATSTHWATRRRKDRRATIATSRCA